MITATNSPLPAEASSAGNFHTMNEKDDRTALGDPVPPAQSEIAENVSDAVDAVGTLLFFRHTPWGRRAFIVVTVGASAIAGRWLNGPAKGGRRSSGPTA